MMHHYASRIRFMDPIMRHGTLRKIMPTWLEADGPNVPLGTLCRIEHPSSHAGQPEIFAEVVGVERDSISLVPFGEIPRLFVGARVVAVSGEARLPVGDAYLGRAIDALGDPIDGHGPIGATEFAPLHDALPAPLERVTPTQPLSTGIRTLDGLLTLGCGQRVGIFAASGVGKTSLVSQLARQIEADCCVICLVGERGREVEAIWKRELSNDARARTTLVAATSDQAAALRVRAVHQALALARHWRAQGNHVLFVLDSVTRLAMALRETGLAAGEPPTVRAYTPSVFAAIPRVVEQCGALQSGGAISALMTVLCETDDVDDPISELMKSILDGHIVLSRELAERRHFPAIDVTRSVSRNAAALMSQRHQALAAQAHRLTAQYAASRALIESGLYSSGSNADIDLAIDRKGDLDDYFRQEASEYTPFDEAIEQLATVLVEDLYAA